MQKRASDDTPGEPYPRRGEVLALGGLPIPTSASRLRGGEQFRVFARTQSLKRLPCETRIAKSQQEINHILPPRPEYVVDTSEFQEVKARLAAIENRRKLTDDKGKNRPTLRRTAGDNRPTDTGSSDSTDSSDKQDDDRPTLKRRDQ